MTVNNSINAPTTFTVSNGGTGDASLTAYAVLCGGTTTTGVVQSVSGVGSANQVLTSNGASALPTWQAAPAATGQIVQVQSATLTTTATTSSTSFTNAGLSVNITPTVNTHTIVVFYSMNMSASSSNQLFLNLVRTISGTPTNILIGTGSIGSRIACSNSINGTGNANALWQLNNNFLDSPATTSAVTYSLQWKVDAGTGYFNICAGDVSSTSYPRTASSITVMEVVA